MYHDVNAMCWQEFYIWMGSKDVYTLEDQGRELSGQDGAINLEGAREWAVLIVSHKQPGVIKTSNSKPSWDILFVG